ncbi:ATP-binding protein [Psychromonas sp. psych-6C06]|uniref:GAF domain-containing sensor histidine kinase n=1 Tax=Psychromonas sp. psych-6C06 TaxID=2058089 RepID=UPI00187CDF3B|nr:ATP-binding protein [Psychromonas sp. psych-6C06]
MEDTIRKIIKGVSNTFGHDFLDQISLIMAEIVEADYLFVARLDEKNKVSHTLSLVHQGEHLPNISYDLAGTPCAKVIEDTICCYPRDVSQVFPDDQLLIDMNIKAYIGTPLKNAQGGVFGLIVALYESPIDNQSETTTLFELFSGRIAAEVVRMEFEHQLRSLNERLELKVKKRTKSLEDTLSRLEHAKTKLVESEKMAALGNLVAGVAHEVNTPLGIAITSHSIIEDQHKKLSKKIEQNSLTVSDMQSYLKDVHSSLDLQFHNLERARHLLDNFKRTATDQHIVECEQINLKQYYQRVVDTLHSVLKTKNVDVALTIPDALTVNTLPGIHAQIITNLINNSLMHGFSNKNNNKITLIISQKENDLYEVNYQDNGLGVSKEKHKKIFEPFYTTARKSGGSGLGLSIVYNLITHKLNGNINVIDCEKGFHLHWTFRPQKGL